MTVATFVQPSYPDQSGTQYPVNIDGAIAVLAQIGQQFAPHQAASPNMTVLVDAGRIIKADGTLVSQAQQTTAAFTAPVGNPRIDRIVIDQLTGAISVIAGTPAASPVAPAITAGKLTCAQVLLQTTTTAITNFMITDERATLKSPPMNFAATGTDTYTVSGLTLVSGFDYNVTFANANTLATPTLNGTTIVKEGGSALAVGDIPAGHNALLRQANTNLVLMNPALTKGAVATALDLMSGTKTVAANTVAFQSLGLGSKIHRAYLVSAYDSTGATDVNIGAGVSAAETVNAEFHVYIVRRSGNAVTDQLVFVNGTGSSATVDWRVWVFGP